MVERRCAIAITVFPFINSCTPFGSPIRSRCPGMTSPSSRTSIGALFRIAARDRDPLALAARQLDAALADQGRVSVRQRHDEVVRLRASRGLADLLIRRIRLSVRDVLADGAMKEHRLLRHHRDRGAQRLERHLADVLSVNHDCAFVHVLAGGGATKQRSSCPHPTGPRCRRARRPV